MNQNPIERMIIWSKIVLCIVLIGAADISTVAHVISYPLLFLLTVLIVDDLTRSSARFVLFTCVDYGFQIGLCQANWEYWAASEGVHLKWGNGIDATIARSVLVAGLFAFFALIPTFLIALVRK